MSAIKDREAIASKAEAPDLKFKVRTHRLISVIAIFSMVVGTLVMLAGVAGAVYTWDQAANQGITTPDDASIPGTPVRGPFTMKAQSDIITHHQLSRTDGLYYAQMDRQVPQLDEDGNVVLDENGEPVMVANEARTSWITATTLTTALGLGILAYGVSAFAFVVGLTLLAMGWVVYRLRNAEVALH